MYDESALMNGREIKGKYAKAYALQALAFLISAGLLMFVLLRYDGNKAPTILGITGIFGSILTLIIGIYCMYLSITLGYLKIYETGIVITRARTSGINVWPFSDIELVCRKVPDSGKPYIAVVFKEGSRIRRWRPREITLMPLSAIADYASFLKALEGRVKLVNMQPEVTQETSL